VKILILKPSSLGDVIHALPVLRLLKLARPDAEIHWWVDSNLAPLLEGDPDLARVLRFRRDRWAAPKHWYEISTVIRFMRAQRYDWVIDLQCLARSGAFAWFANGKFLIGLDERREGARGFYDTIVSRPTPQTHAVDWYLRVLPALGIPVHNNFDWLPERKELAAALREKFKTDRSRWIALQPGARWETKRWLAENFVELARLIEKDLPGHSVAVLGGGDDRALGESIAQAAGGRCVNLAGQLALLETVEFLRTAAALVSNDTGPMHIAAALGKPVVALFGPTDPRRTGPYGQVEKVLRRPPPCAPCFKGKCANPNQLECLRTITPADVLAELKSRLPA
jgi:lipopolysaccharide heptosyltransferase I